MKIEEHINKLVENKLFNCFVDTFFCNFDWKTCNPHGNYVSMYFCGDPDWD